MDWLDRARGLGILLVVLGHVLGGLLAAGILPDRGAPVRAVDVVYAFHMPLFFFLSGLVAEGGARSSFGALVRTKVATIAWPYFAWSALQVLLHSAAAGNTNQSVGLGALARLLWEPVMQFWFLYVLFVVSLAWAAARRAGAPAALLAGLALALWFVPGRAGLGDWGVAYMIASNAVWFAAGATAGAARVAARIHVRAAIVPAVALLGWSAWMACGGFGSPSPTGMLALDLVRGAVASAGILGSLLLVVAIGRGGAWTRGTAQALGVLGRASLPIYLAHTIAAAGLRSVLLALGVRDAAVHVAAGFAVGVLAPLALDEASRRAGFHWIFSLRGFGRFVSAPRRAALEGA